MKAFTGIGWEAVQLVTHGREPRPVENEPSNEVDDDDDDGDF
jgi:hypothetical protein